MKNCLKCFQFINYFFSLIRDLCALPAIKSHSNVSFSAWDYSLLSVSLIICKERECVWCGGEAVPFHRSLSSRRERTYAGSEKLTLEENWKKKTSNEIWANTFVKCCRTCRRQINKIHNKMNGIPHIYISWKWFTSSFPCRHFNNCFNVSCLSYLYFFLITSIQLHDTLNCDSVTDPNYKLTYTFFLHINSNTISRVGVFSD